MMVVLSIEHVPPALRGALTRWMIEIRPSVYVGTMSPRIRDRLWERTTERVTAGSVVMIWSARTEQGFQLRTWGDPTYRPREFEGLTLVSRPSASRAIAAKVGERALTGQDPPSPD